MVTNVRTGKVPAYGSREMLACLSERGREQMRDGGALVVVRCRKRERRFAAKLLRRAASAGRDNQAALWRLVVAASRKSGRA